MKEESQTPSAFYDDKKNFIIKEIMFWVYHVSIIILAALLITYAGRAREEIYKIEQTDHYDRAMETIDFWGKGYIIDIKAVSTMNCPQGYEPLIDYKWDGTREGCNCPTMLNNYYYEFILPVIVERHLIHNGCERIPYYSAENMNFWKGAKLLCTKRIKSLTFFNSTYPASTTNCSSNQPYQVQTYINVSCPISVTSNSSIASNQTTLTLNSTTSESIYFTSMTGYPIAAFKLTYYYFCPVFSQKNISPNKTGNYLLEPNNITTCYGKDPRITMFDLTDEETLINNNYNVKADIALLPSYPRPSNVYMFKLGFIRYPAWTYACRTNSYLNLNSAASHLKLEDYKVTGLYIFSFTTAFAIAFGFLLRLFYLIRRIKELKGKSEYGRIYENYRELARRVPNLNYVHNRKIEVFWIVFDLLLTIGLIAVYFIFVKKFTEYSLWYKTVFQNSCTDNYINLILQNYEISLDKGYYNLVACIVMALFALLLDILFLIYRCVAGDLKKHPNEVVEYSVSEDDANRMMAPLPDDSLQIKDKDLNLELYVAYDGIYRETKDNFFNIYGGYNDLGVKKKKKKKKPIKKKNLFRRDEPAEDSKQPE